VWFPDTLLIIQRRRLEFLAIDLQKASAKKLTSLRGFRVRTSIVLSTPCFWITFAWGKVGFLGWCGFSGAVLELDVVVSFVLGEEASLLELYLFVYVTV